MADDRDINNDRKRSTAASVPSYAPKTSNTTDTGNVGETGTVDVFEFEKTLRDVDIEFNRTMSQDEKREVGKGRYSKPLGGK